MSDHLLVLFIAKKKLFGNKKYLREIMNSWYLWFRRKLNFIKDLLVVYLFINNNVYPNVIIIIGENMLQPFFY